MPSIGPHGGKCPRCHGKCVTNIVDNRCPACHNTGRACPGGPVREAVYCAYGAFDPDSEVVYICQTCNTIVPAEEVQHA